MYPVFAICDLETDYAIRFMEYLNLRKLPFEVRMFTSLEPLLELGRKTKIALLLISERAMCEAVQALDIGKVILLSETKAVAEDGFPSVYKYQAASGIIREVLDCYSAEEAATGRSPALACIGKRVGFYGLTDPRLQMLTALTYGQILAERRSVLYLNLHKHSGLDMLLDESPQGDLSDLLYLFRTGQSGFSYRLSGLMHKIGEMDYIPVPFCSEDIGELAGEEWLAFFARIQTTCDREVLLLDLGEAVRGLPGILSQCKSRILLTGGDPFSERQRQALEREWDMEALAGTHWVSPPQLNDLRQGRWFLESLPSSALGKWLRAWMETS